VISERADLGILKFRSYIDFRRQSWLFGEQHYETGIYKTRKNIFYDIKWSPSYDYVLADEIGEVRISPSSWSLPFHLEIERTFFAQNATASDDRLAVGLHRFIAHLIDCIEHIYLEIDVIKFKVDGRPILFDDASSAGWRRLRYTEQKVNTEEIFEEYSLMGDTGHYDVVCGEAADRGSLEVSWQFLIDSIASFDSGHFRGSVIYACCALEVEVVPVIRAWLSENTHTKPTGLLRDALVELSNPFKFEIFFGCGKVDALGVFTGDQRDALLESLKWLNNLRNRVIHSGEDVKPEEAKKAIRVAGILLRVIWVHKRQQFFNKYGINDIFPDLNSKVQGIDL